MGYRNKKPNFGTSRTNFARARAFVSNAFLIHLNDELKQPKLRLIRVYLSTFCWVSPFVGMLCLVLPAKMVLAVIRGKFVRSNLQRNSASPVAVVLRRRQVSCNSNSLLLVQGLLLEKGDNCWRMSWVTHVQVFSGQINLSRWPSQVQPKWNEKEEIPWTRCPLTRWTRSVHPQRCLKFIPSSQVARAGRRCEW